MSIPAHDEDPDSGVNVATSSLTGAVDASAIGPARRDVHRGRQRRPSDHQDVHLQRRLRLDEGSSVPSTTAPTLSREGGGAIPVKFSLSELQGYGFFASGYPRSIQISCSTIVEEDAVEETVTAERQRPHRHASIDQYIYVWNFSKQWAVRAARGWTTAPCKSRTSSSRSKQQAAGGSPALLPTRLASAWQHYPEDQADQAVRARRASEPPPTIAAARGGGHAPSLSAHGHRRRTHTQQAACRAGALGAGRCRSLRCGAAHRPAPLRSSPSSRTACGSTASEVESTPYEGAAALVERRFCKRLVDGEWRPFFDERVTLAG